MSIQEDQIRLTPSQLEELFKILVFRKGKWKNITAASKKLNISRPTIYKVLRQYPQGMPIKPKKTLPKYFEEWEQTETAKAIKELLSERSKDPKTGQIVFRLTRHGEKLHGILREAWKLKNKKDPLTFDLQDFLFFFGTATQAPHVDFIDPQTNKIDFAKAVALRFTMRLSRDPDIKGLIDDPRFTTKGLKREAGRHKHMYLEPADIIKVVNVINEPDTLLLFFLGILLGGRFSAFARLKVANIHRQAQYLDLYEPKVERTVEKDLWDFALEFIWRYIIDFNRTDLLFHYDLYEYNERLKRAGKDANIAFELTTHVALKHTCITLMSLHGIDIDVISEYVGTDADTIMKYYRGGGKEKIRAQVLGLPRVEKTWRQLWVELMPYFIARYEHIKPYATTIDGIKTVKPPQQVRG